MSGVRAFALTSLAMLAFAGNSMLCRLALAHTSIDAASFTFIRLLSGAAMLWLVVRIRGSTRPGGGSWSSALALFVYAAGFSFAYVGLSVATGALLLFGAVQATMIGAAVWKGERLRLRQVAGLLLALVGLIWLLLPGLTAPPLFAAGLMLGAGVAWGVYSLRGRGAGDPTQVTAGNFLRAVPIALILILPHPYRSAPDITGVWCAVASGALTSALGYAIWYAALRGLTATSAAVVQLCVPVLATLGGAALLNEPITSRLILSSSAILGGIAIVILGN
jgi:drug/metabolite transporter (DMT)-like permease